jgi:hypothetical protein
MALLVRHFPGAANVWRGARNAQGCQCAGIPGRTVSSTPCGDNQQLARFVDHPPELSVPFDQRTVTRGHLRKHLSSGSSRRLLTALLCILLCWTASCASTGGAQKSTNSDALITRDDIENSHQPTLYDVVRALRPNWLRSPPTAVRAEANYTINVYLDSQRAGGVEVLQQMPSTSASSIRFYGASEAQSRFGLGNLGGVIQVVSSRGTD